MTEAGDDVETRLSKSLDQIIQEGGGGDGGLTTRPGKVTPSQVNGRYGDRDRFVDRERFGDRDRRGRGGRGRFGGRGPGGPFVVGRGEGRGPGGRGGGFVPMIHLSYFWSTDPMANESVKVHLLKTDVVEVKSNGDVILNTGGFKNWMTRAAMNVVLGPVGIKVEGEDGDREPWKVKKGAWSQDLEDTLKISAFASRDWPVVRMALEGLPTSVTRDTPVLPSVLGKRPPPPQPVPPPMYVYPFPPPPPPRYGGFFPRGGPKRFRLA